MKSVYRWFRAWLPVFLWMIVIYYFSSRQRVAISDVFTINFLLFKTLHVIEYAALYFLLLRGFYLTVYPDKPIQIYRYAFIVALLYAVSDEIHQTFVPTREGKIWDIMIDTIGIGIMYTLIKKKFSLFKKIV
ncbi:VanZ family protein [Candidatus Roizmanbacteria bacterium]|nr:VanZ family protein [Candidatus Roizmanbacteria bacterium]